ncbi:hypothetical protein FACS189494_05180 [Spirochaetia bacterium]|nr:hypothetical protein FACS189494_05180 [Spirochaetia bacterium]
MGIMKVATAEQYEKSLRKLFPLGEYWDRQFSDPQSDCSLFCKAKSIEIVRFRNRMAALLDESIPRAATELIGDWERVLLNAKYPKLDLDTRREQLEVKRDANVNRAVLNEISEKYGVTVSNMEFPFRPAFFGFSRFGIERIASPAAFSVLFIFCIMTDTSVQASFEMEITSRLLSSHIIYFVYQGGNN